MNKTCKKIKNIGNSPLYIISAVLLLLSALAVALKYITAPEYFSEVIAPFIPGTELGYVPDYYRYLTDFAFIPFLLKALLDAFTAFGMIFVFITMCRKSEKSCKLGFGMGFIKPAVIIETVALSLIAALIFTLQFMHIMPFFVELIDVGETVPENEITLLLVTFAVAVFLIICFSIYVRKVFMTARAVDKTLKKGVIMGKVSVYLIVFNFIIVFAGIALLVLTCMWDKSDYIMKASVLLYTVSRLFANINLISMRSEMLYIKSRGYTS